MLCARKPATPQPPAHTKGISYLRLRAPRTSGTPGSRWSAAKMWKRAKTGVERHLFTVRVGVAGGEEWRINFPRRAAILQYSIPQSIPNPYTDFEFIPVLYF